MYNVGYGDCFCLRDRKSNLLVDFGTSNRLIGGRPRREVFDEIISDLSTIEDKDLLLTHFHLDHLSGLLYMMRSKNPQEFGCIYLPDLFSQNEMADTLSLLLLTDLLKDFYLPSKQVSLYALVEALCRRPQKVGLLRRGTVFEGKYQALWPDVEQISGRIGGMVREIQKRYAESWYRLTDYAENLRRVVYSMTEEGRGEAEEWGPSRAAQLEREFLELRQSIGFEQMLHFVEEQKFPLRELKNEISVVFQNAEDGEWNLLFTGDASASCMKRITGNYDGKFPLYQHYWCIKVPHHGTHSHYYDFSSYSPENLLISNGVYYSNSRKKEKACRVSASYSGLFYIPGATMYCSDSACCEGGRNGCTCKEKDIITPHCYRDI